MTEETDDTRGEMLEARKLLQQDREQRAERCAQIIRQALAQLDCEQVPILVIAGGRIVEHLVQIRARE